jgi:hypothetical protein
VNRDIPRTKKAAFTLIAALMVMCFVEFLAWAALTRIVPSRLRNRAAFRAPEDYIRAYRNAVLGSGASGVLSRDLRMFHPDLGWDYPPNFHYKDERGVSYRHGPHGERSDGAFPFDTALIATYGDSFCYCADVGDPETWQTYLGETLGAGTLNFGVAGYGTDQAYLKYELNAAGARAPVAMLCILPDDINRIVNVFRTFYAPDDRVGLTKPRYVLEGASLRLLANPLSSSQDVAELEDPDFVRSLGERDYWFQRDVRLPHLGVPYIRSLILWRDIWWDYVAFGLALRFPALRPVGSPGNLFDEKEPLTLMCKITDAFAHTAKSRSAAPIIVIMAHKELIRETMTMGKSRAAPLTDHLKKKGYPFIDLIVEIAALNPSRADLDRWYDEHATPEGNRMTAGLIAGRLKNLKTRQENFPLDLRKGAGGTAEK